MEFQPGRAVETVRVFSQEEFNRFAAISGDNNPIHIDPEFSARTRFGRTVAHGMFLYGHISHALAARLPGPGFRQVWTELMFQVPTFVGEPVRFRLEAAGTLTDELTEVDVQVIRPDGALGCQGKAGMGRASETKSTRSPELGEGTGKEHRARGREAVGELPVVGSYKGLQLGASAGLRRTFTSQDLREYYALFGAEPGLEWQTIPGPLLGGMFSCLLGTRLPGRGTNWLKQKLAYPADAATGEEISATVEITRLRPEKDLVNLKTVCTLPNGRVVCQGEALVYIGDLEG